MTTEHRGINELFDCEWELSEDGMSVIIDDRIEIVLTSEAYKNCTTEEREFIMQSISLIPDMLEVIACTGEEKTLPENVLTTKDLAHRYGVSLPTIYKKIRKGKLPTPKTAIGRGCHGKNYYWEAEEIEEFEKGITNENN